MRAIPLVMILMLLVSCGESDKKKNNVENSEVTSSPNDLLGKKTYQNSADGNTYKSDKDWKLYKSGELKIDTGKVKLKHHILLTLSLIHI